MAAVRGGEPGGVRVRVAAATPSPSQLSDSDPESAPGRLGVARGEGGWGEGFTPSPPQSDSERRGEESDSEWRVGRAGELDPADGTDGWTGWRILFWRIIICFKFYSRIDYRPPWHMVWPFRITLNMLLFAT